MPEIFLIAHLSEETLEEYAFNRLSEAEAEPLEEHLLVCGACQEKLGEVDDYIRLMKRAVVKRPTAARTGSSGWGEKSTWGLIGAIAAMVVAGAWLNIPVPPAAKSTPLELVAFRGGESMAHASAGRLLDLSIDLSDLSRSNAYRVQVVNSAGRQEWSGEAETSDAKLIVHLSKALRPGLHWVRVSSSDGELLREFGLRAD